MRCGLAVSVVLGVLVAASAAGCASAPPGHSPRVSFAAPAQQPSEQGTGYLTVAAVPPAKMYIDDGKDKTWTTPVVRLELKVGRHQVTLVPIDDTKRPRTLGIVIKAGEVTNLRVNL